jgi:hypothetical protein
VTEATAIPVTTPVEPIVAAVPLLLHAPPLVKSVSEIAAPTHTLVAPLIGFGNGFTVIVLVFLHPVPRV